MQPIHIPDTGAGHQNPGLGWQDDGESISSHTSQFSAKAVRSDKSENVKKKLKSGMYDKIADDVVMKLKWPHKRLDPRWVTPRPLVHQLSFEQVVAGEVSIIMRSTDDEEVRGRLHILRKLAYWNMQGEGWPRLREIYISILHSLEEGEAQWDSSFDHYDMAFPVRHTPAPRGGKRAETKRDVFWCKDYNKSTCSLESGHKAMVAGKDRVVSHICAVCWKQGKKEKHPEGDPTCPAKEL